MNFWKFTCQYILQYKKWYALGSLFIFFTQLCISLIIEYSRHAIDAMNSPNASSDMIIPYCIMILLLASIAFFVRVSTRLLFFIPGRNMEYKVRNDYLQILLDQDRNFFQSHESGDIVSRNASDVQSIRAAYGYSLMQFVYVIITLGLGTTAMLRLNSEITLYLVIPILLGFSLVQWHVRYIFQDLKRSNIQLAEISSFCLSSFRSIFILQAYHAEAAITQKFSQLNQNYFATHLKIACTYAIIAPIVRLIGELATFIIIFFIGPYIIEKKMSLGEITGFLGYIAMIMPPIMSLGWSINMLQRAIPSIDRVMEILSLQKPSTRNTPLSSFPHKENLILEQTVHLVVSKLSFCYESASKHRVTPFALQDITFDLPNGKVLAIMGNIGSGKSTLVETLLRLNKSPKQSLFLNGKDANDIDLEKYRSYFSWAGQQTFLFSSSLRENLNLAVPSSEWKKTGWDNHLLKYLDIVQFDLSEKIFPNGLDTMVGEKGIMLSGGQRQRIALARCLLKPAAIYILDDILAAVDFETEQNILKRLQEWHEQKSIILISHRLTTISWADEILVMDDGKVLAQGSHDFLLQNCPYYRQIWEHQTIRGHFD